MAACPAVEPLLQFKSHIDGKNADVSIFGDRIEWAQHGRLVRGKDSNMIPLKSVSSVTTKRDGLVNTIVNVHAGAQAIGFRVGHGQAAQVKDTITQLLLGGTPAPAAAAPPPPPPPSSTPPPPPAPPAGWMADPTGRHELRYWTGAGWSADVSDGGVQATDPV